MDSSIGGDAVAAGGIGLNLATGNWIGAAIGAVGLGTSIFGGMGSASVSRQQSQLSMNEAQEEQQQNVVKQQMMEMQGRRAQTETLRIAQRARAASIQSGYSQTGSITGTGVQGGLSEDESKGYYGLQGINNNMQFSNTMFGINSAINQDKYQMAALGGTAATDAGITSIGGALMQVGGTVGKMSQSLNGKSSNPFYGPLDG